MVAPSGENMELAMARPVLTAGFSSPPEIAPEAMPPAVTQEPMAKPK